MGGGSSIVNAATSIKFYTAANTTTTTGTERLRITAGGQTLFTGVSGTTPLDIKTSNSTNNTVQPLIEAYADNATYKAQIGLVREGSSGLLGWAFLTNAVGSPTERMRITSDGVGIGTDGYGNVAPLAPLHVSSYSPTTTITTHGELRSASQLLSLIHI